MTSLSGERLAITAICLAMTGLTACGDDARRPGGDTGSDTAADVARDTATDTAAECRTDADCDDGFPCTIDGCGVGGVCTHDPTPTCGAGEICSPERGCISGCVEDADCQNDSYCDGPERCIGDQCFAPIRAIDCNDGNECTTDTCSEETLGCVYTGCDAGTVTDGGGPPPEFDPDVHYAGTFVVAPAPSLGCPPSSYAIGNITFTRTDEELRVRADRFTLTQRPPPAGNMFRVTGTDSGCTSVSLEGAFENGDQLMATWNANCGTCGMQTRMIFGERDD